MKNFFNLESGLPNKRVIKFLYYLLLIAAIAISIFIIIDGLTDPFGELLILLGVLALILLPIFLRIIFGLLLQQHETND